MYSRVYNKKGKNGVRLSWSVFVSIRKPNVILLRAVNLYIRSRPMYAKVKCVKYATVWEIHWSKITF